jgi:hypothetical protein
LHFRPRLYYLFAPGNANEIERLHNLRALAALSPSAASAICMHDKIAELYVFPSDQARRWASANPG